jgi:hypothetical protein
MALTATTLSAAVTVTDLVMPVTSATGFATSATAPQFMRVDSEYMIISPSLNVAPYSGSKNIPVYRRGDQGSAVVKHNALANVVTGLFSDITTLQAGAMTPLPVPVDTWPVVTYSVNGAIAIPSTNTIVQLDKAAVAAMTLAAPGLDQDGVSICIVGTTAQANTITCPSAIIMDGLSGSPHTVWTATTGYKGQGVTFMALAGFWVVTAVNTGAFT